MPQVTLTILPDGHTKVEVQGVPGQACYESSAAIQGAIGKTIADAKTGEFFQAQEAPQGWSATQ